jgi:predicted nicotinamide N-methyase
MPGQDAQMADNGSTGSGKGFEPPDPLAFIPANLRLLPAPSLPEVRLYTAHPASGLWRLAGQAIDSPAPYWAYHWAGGTVLARHIFVHPEIVRRRRVLDLGTGSGIVGIAAAMCGAAAVIAADTDANAIAAAQLNAAANGVSIETVDDDLTAGPPPEVDLILAGDLFYDEFLAVRVLAFLKRCRAAGIEVLVGDPGRGPLPRAALRLVAEYPIRDFGDLRSGAEKISGVFAIE